MTKITISGIGGLELVNKVNEDVSQFSGFKVAKLRSQSQKFTNVTLTMHPTLKFNSGHPVTFTVKLSNSNLLLWEVGFRTVGNTKITDNHFRHYCRMQVKKFVEPVLLDLPVDSQTKTRSMSFMTATTLAAHFQKNRQLKDLLFQHKIADSLEVEELLFSAIGSSDQNKAIVECARVGKIRSKTYTHLSLAIFKTTTRTTSKSLIKTNWMGGYPGVPPKGELRSALNEALNSAYRNIKDIYLLTNEE